MTDTPRENVQSYPRPPALEAVPQRIRIMLGGQWVAESTRALRVLETHHAPTYYLPPDDVSAVLQPAVGSSFCEWKGKARYFDVIVGETTAKRAAWAYDNPTERFAPLAGYLAFYAGLIDHVVLQDKGLFSLTGGKWTTWRRMAEDCMDIVVKTKGLNARACQTQELRLPGANGDTAAAEAALKDLPEDIADYLWQAYGDRAHLVLAEGSPERLVSEAPYVEAELVWAMRYEGACKADDVLYRRLRVGMLDQQAADQIGARLQQLVNAA